MEELELAEKRQVFKLLAANPIYVALDFILA